MPTFGAWLPLLLVCPSIFKPGWCFSIIAAGPFTASKNPHSSYNVTICTLTHAPPVMVHADSSSVTTCNGARSSLISPSHNAPAGSCTLAAGPSLALMPGSSCNALDARPSLHNERGVLISLLKFCGVYTTASECKSTPLLFCPRPLWCLRP